MAEELSERVSTLARAAKQASRALANADTARKNVVLLRAAAALRGPEGDAVIHANAEDFAQAIGAGEPAASVDRLRLDRGRLDAVAERIETIAALPDPVGELLEQRRQSSGLETARMRVPLGLLGIIYEARPDVSADAAALCIKSGNGVLLWGGAAAARSDRAIVDLFAHALRAEGFAPEAVTLLPTPGREGVEAMIRQRGVIDLLIVRAGRGLTDFVAENASVPVIQHGAGVCHLFVQREADLNLALRLTLDATTQGALGTLLVDVACAPAFLPDAGAMLSGAGVRLVADERAQALLAGLPRVDGATEDAWGAEYPEPTLNVAIVDHMDAALDHVARYGTHHTEAIVTKNASLGRRWTREVDASLVLVNASTRFNDGRELGLGAEMGISTTKLHAYGPMGLNELCTTKWVGYGNGQVR